MVASKIPKPELIACQKKYLEASLSRTTAAADPIYGDPAVCAPPVIQHVDDGTRNIHGHCGRDYRDQVLCGVTLSKP